MPIETRCPYCGQGFRVLETLQGKKVVCKSCQEPFIVKDARAKARMAEEIEEVEPISDEEEQIQNQPRKRIVPARLRGEDSSPSPRRRRREEDSENLPVRKKPPISIQRTGPPTGLIIGAIAGGFFLLTGSILVILWVASSSTNNPVAKANPPIQEKAADPHHPAWPNPNAQQGGQTNPNFAPGGGAMAGGPGLKYRWKGGPHVYSVKVEIEEPDSIEVHQGFCTIRSQPAGQVNILPQIRRSTGTGFVVHPNGYLLTCHHVVEGATSIEVSLGGQKYPATVVASDPANDLAVVQINAGNLQAVSLADSDQIHPGERVTVLGFPLASELGTGLKITNGNLSGINEQAGRKVFQVDAAINPGNSGGPIVSDTGAVIGVASAKLVGEAVSNVGFVTPINEARRLLTNKAIPFTSAVAAAPKLDGPAVFRQISPMVALLTVTGGADSGGDKFRLSCTGTLTKTERPKFGMPRIGPPSFPRFNPASQIEVSSRGEILQANGGTQLPALLGEMGIFLLDPLPADQRTTWETSSTFTLTEENNNSPFPRMHFGPRFGPPGLRPPGFGQPNEGRSRQGQERNTYTQGQLEGNKQLIHKRHVLKVPPAIEAPGLDLAAQSTIRFDTQQGVPYSVDLQGTLTITKGQTTSRLPVQLTYKLLEGPDRDRILNPSVPKTDPKKAEPQKPTPGDLDTLLTNLKDPNNFKKMNALSQLAELQPTLRRDEVLQALNATLKESDPFVRTSCLKALGVWGHQTSVPLILELLEDKDFFVRKSCMEALAKLKDDRAAEPLAKRVLENQDRHDAINALKALGAKAEKAVLPLLDNSSVFIRFEVCRLLKEIGTPASLPALEKIAGGKFGLDVNAAKEAITSIQSRKAKGN